MLALVNYRDLPPLLGRSGCIIRLVLPFFFFATPSSGARSGSAASAPARPTAVRRLRAEGRTVVWRIRPMGGFRAMIYMERFVDGAETPDRQELWYLDNSEAAITFQSWRHVRPHLFAGATSDQRRLDNEYIYDLRRNEGIDLKAEWREGHFVMRTIRPSSSTGPAGHPDSRPNINMIVGPDVLVRTEQFTEGPESGETLSMTRVTESQ